MRLGVAILITTLGLFLPFGSAQTLPPKKSAAVPSQQKARPTLGFNSRKDVYPVFETHVYGMKMNENELRRRFADARERYELLLNDANLRGDGRWEGLEEARTDLARAETDLREGRAKIEEMQWRRDSLAQAFLDAFRDSKECKGITFYASKGQKPAFTVQLSVTGGFSKNQQQTWGWWLRWPSDPSPANREGHGFGGTGTQSSAELAARDVCLKIWDDVDSGYSKKSGGGSE